MLPLVLGPLKDYYIIIDILLYTRSIIDMFQLSLMHYPPNFILAITFNSDCFIPLHVFFRHEILKTGYLHMQHR